MRLGPIDFTPRLVPTVAAGCLVVLFVGLGFWQLERAKVKSERFEGYARRAGAPPVSMGSLTPGVIDVDGLRHRRATAAGRFETERQFLLDNRTDGGVAGYHVLTPMHLQGASRALLVNRGWVPVGARRSVLPDISISQEKLEIAGTVSIPSRGQILLGPTGYAVEGWPRVVQNIDFEAMERVTGHPFLPLVLRLDASDPNGFLRRWVPRLGSGPDRNRGYAVQWFALAATLIVIYGIMVLKRRPRPGDRK